MHRARQGYIEERTALINRIRGLLSELGIALPLKTSAMRREALAVLEDLPGWCNTAIGDMLNHLGRSSGRAHQRVRQISRTNIRWACPTLEPTLPDTVTQLTLAMLGELFDPRKVVAMRRDVLVRFLSRHASGNHPKSGPFINSLVEKLKSVAEETIELHGDSVDFVALQFEVVQEVELLRLWDCHVRVIEREVEQIYQRVHPSDALRSIPSIGATLAPLLISVLGYAKRFRNEDHIRGFCGMFPTRNSSGGIQKLRAEAHKERQ